MHALKRDEQGFGTIEGILIVVVVVLIGAAGWFMYNRHHNAIPIDDNKKSTTQTTKTTPAKNYLTIKEWGVRVPVANNVNTTDIYYVIKDDGAVLASHKLSSVAASCDPLGTGSTPFGWIERLTPADYQTALNDSANTGVTSGTKLGNYYYAWQVRRANCAGIPSAASDQANVLMYGGATGNLGDTFILDDFPSNMPDVLKSIEVTSN